MNIGLTLLAKKLALALHERQRFRLRVRGCVGKFLHKYPSMDDLDIWTLADRFAKLSSQEIDPKSRTDG